MSVTTGIRYTSNRVSRGYSQVWKRMAAALRHLQCTLGSSSLLLRISISVDTTEYVHSLP